MLLFIKFSPTHERDGVFGSDAPSVPSLGSTRGPPLDGGEGVPDEAVENLVAVDGLLAPLEQQTVGAADGQRCNLRKAAP